MRIESDCGACSRPIRIDVDQDLHWESRDDTGPLIFEPSIDWTRFREPNIVHAY